MNDEQTYIDFLASVEQHTGKTVRYPAELGRLLRIAAARSMEQVFADMIFHATFVVKTRDVMKRIGGGAEGFDTLSAQFSEGVERVTTLIRTLIKEEPDAWKQEFSARFLSMNQDSLNSALDLLADLSLIKHWELDGRPLPFPGYVPPRREQRPGTSRKDHHLRTLIQTARLSLLLLIVLFIIDGPFTLLGWITAVIVAGLLVVVLYEGAAAQKASAEKN